MQGAMAFTGQEDAKVESPIYPRRRPQWTIQGHSFPQILFPEPEYSYCGNRPCSQSLVPSRMRICPLSKQNRTQSCWKITKLTGPPWEFWQLRLFRPLTTLLGQAGLSPSPRESETSKDTSGKDGKSLPNHNAILWTSKWQLYLLEEMRKGQHLSEWLNPAVSGSHVILLFLSLNTTIECHCSKYVLKEYSSQSSSHTSLYLPIHLFTLSVNLSMSFYVLPSLIYLNNMWRVALLTPLS